MHKALVVRDRMNVSTILSGVNVSIPCAFDSCGLPSARKGLCNGHSQQHYKGIELKPLKKRRSTKSLNEIEVFCSFDPCNREAWEAGLCRGHYNHKFQGKELAVLVGTPGYTRDKGFCSVSFCNEDNYCNSLCKNHYWSFSHLAVTKEHFLQIMDSAVGCEICGSTSRRLVIDHDHRCCKSGRGCAKCIRGLLCQSCNTSLGKFQDSVDVLSKAIAYLNKKKELTGA